VAWQRTMLFKSASPFLSKLIVKSYTEAQKKLVTDETKASEPYLAARIVLEVGNRYDAIVITISQSIVVQDFEYSIVSFHNNDTSFEFRADVINPQWSNVSMYAPVCCMI